ncbi:MAG: hypothetical protein CME64_12435 [Halobacteriovoraceae bacterium]|nr:hypothetical protein [Halobacteriovoraceae bacterium]|tara:strand:- start:206461 stop:207276 length:816 start_codon:yes stop_codon:yes gene_type:complete
MWLLTSAKAAQWARVSAEKAIIYSDVEMSSPIGFLKRGQKLRVGDVPRNKGRVLPTVYKERVVFVKTTDIQTNKNQAVVKTASMRIKDQIERKSRESLIAVGANGLASTIDDPDALPGSPDSYVFSGLGVQGVIREFDSPKALLLNMSYLQATEDTRSIETFLIGVDQAYRFINLEKYDMSAFAGVLVSPYSQYEIDNQFKVNGYGAGVEVGINSLVKLGRTVGILLEAKYQYLKFFGFDLPESTTNITVQEDFSPSIFGPSFGAFLSFSF